MSKCMSLGGSGAAAPNVEDVLKVALNPSSVSLEIDSSALDRIKKESPAPKNFVAEDNPAQPSDDAVASELNPECARAAVFCRLLNVVNGKSGIRPVVVQALVALLNQDRIPRLPLAASDAEVLSVLADCMHGSTDGLAACFGEAGPPKLSSAERKQLCTGRPVTCGQLALTVAQGRVLLPCTVTVAALSAEALQANVTTLDAANMEAAHSSASGVVAEEFMSMLDGSKMINARKGGVDIIEGFTQVPNAHALAQSTLDVTHSAVQSELQSTALPLNKNGAPTLPLSLALPRHALTLAAALLDCAALSLERCCRLHGAVLDAAGPGDSAATEALLQRLLTQLQRREVLSAQLATAPLAAAPPPPAAGAGAEAAAQPPPPPSLTLPSVRIAALADSCAAALRECAALEALLALVRLRQLESAAAAAPPPKKGAPAGVCLGRGSAAMRAFLQGEVGGADAPLLACAALADVSADAVRSAHAAILAALDPSKAALAARLAELKRTADSAANSRRKYKTPKGTQDFHPQQMTVRQMVFGKIEAVFQRHGAVTIDTPVFELRETLTGKYGEDSKLIYDLADQGGELLSLRYDLTVPFARYVAEHGVGNIKRYHIGKVYRRDQPMMKRGRFREFCQCDFDIAGRYENMVADSEALKVLTEILTDLDIGSFVVKLNHRRLLDAIMAIAGVPADKFRTICSAIDKLDKEEWSEVRREMTEDKGLAADVADKIGEYVVLRGEPRVMLDKLRDMPEVMANGDASAALADLAVVFDNLEAMAALRFISFDLSLARGLDYYTGVIYEAVLSATTTDDSNREVSVGSVAAGGRYDGLVGMYSGKDVPAVGVSIGVERVYTIMEGQLTRRAASDGKKIRQKRTQVFVGSVGPGLQRECMKLCAELWEAGIQAEFTYKPNPKMKSNLEAGFDGTPFLVVVAENELAEGLVMVKDFEEGARGGDDQEGTESAAPAAPAPGEGAGLVEQGAKRQAPPGQYWVPRTGVVADLKQRIESKGGFRLF